MTSSALAALAAAALLIPTAVHAQRADLPPPEKVNEALDGHPTVVAAQARVRAAQARAGMLNAGSHEVTLTGSQVRRSVEREGDFAEYDATLTRAFRLPNKVALDRQAGALGVEAAENQMEDTRHQAALTLSSLWHDWLTASELHRSDADTVAAMESALAAVRRRVELRDAAPLELDQAAAALAQARAQAAAALADREQARATLAATFPEIPLPVEPPRLATPEPPPLGLEVMRGLVIERSHEIRAADREAERLKVLSRRAGADRFADPSFGVRLFSERGGLEQGAAFVASVPLGGSYRRAVAEQAAAEASAGALELANVKREVTVMADTDLTNARTRMEAWKDAAAAAASSLEAARRTERGYQLGQIDLADLLYARRLANDAARAEIAARSEADRALLKLQIDSHSVWIDEPHESAP